MANHYLDKEQKFNIEEMQWSEVRDDVYKCNPELAEKCDAVNRSQDYSLFKVYYPYGSSIVNKGEFCLPTMDGKTIPIKDEKVPEYLKNKLMYSTIPLSLVIKNSSEVFVKAENKVVPLNFLVSGELFGLFELMNLLTQVTLQDIPIWSVSAGVRSTFMLPGIADGIGHTRIKKKISADIHFPCSLSDHWQTFADINKYSCNINSWQNIILVFSKEWFVEESNTAYIEFYKYLVGQCWKQFQLLENFTKFSLLWSFFTHAINKRSLKPRPYLIDTIKYLILIANGSGIGFSPSISDIALPTSLIQKVYIDDYNLKDYIPNIMQSAKLAKGSKVYYSLSFPTLLESSSYLKNPPSIIEDQRDIKKLFDILMDTIDQIDNPSISKLKNIKFELFHSGNDPFGQIISSKVIPEDDTRFLEYSSNSKEKRVFCSSSSFFNGCVRISYD